MTEEATVGDEDMEREVLEIVEILYYSKNIETNKSFVWEFLSSLEWHLMPSVVGWLAVHLVAGFCTKLWVVPSLLMISFRSLEALIYECTLS